MKQQLTDLLSEFGTAIGLSEPETLVRGAPFSVSGYIFSFGEQPKNQAGSVLLFADFGAIPEANKAAVYYRILCENYLEFPTRNGTYGVSCDTGNIVCARALPLATMSVDMLIVSVSQLVEQALWWQREYADGHEQASPASMRRPASIVPMPARPMITS